MRDSSAGLLQEAADQAGIFLESIFLGDVPCPRSAREWDGVIALGGRMNCLQEAEYPFLVEEKALLHSILTDQTPFLGICLGAQLLAICAGGRVELGCCPQHGDYPLTFTEAGQHDPLFAGFPTQIQAFESHSDCIADIGSGIALSEPFQGCHQAFRVGPCAYGLQFHPEPTECMARAWLEKDFADAPDKADHAAAAHEARAAEHRQRALLLFKNFCKIAGIPADHLAAPQR